jgi:hypothetical protein
VKSFPASVGAVVSLRPLALFRGEVSSDQGKEARCDGDLSTIDCTQAFFSQFARSLRATVARQASLRAVFLGNSWHRHGSVTGNL